MAAIVKVVGKADDFEIIFTSVGDNKWVVTVPSDLDGEYIVDVYAYDEAGNVGRVIKSLFVVDTANLICKLVPLKYSGEVIDPQFESSVKGKKFEVDCAAIREAYFGIVRAQNYYLEVVKCE